MCWTRCVRTESTSGKKFQVFLTPRTPWKQPHIHSLPTPRVSPVAAAMLGCGSNPQQMLEWEENHTSQGKQTINTGIFWETQPPKARSDWVLQCRHSPSSSGMLQIFQVFGFSCSSSYPTHTIWYDTRIFLECRKSWTRNSNSWFLFDLQNWEKSSLTKSEL